MELAEYVQPGMSREETFAVEERHLASHVERTQAPPDSIAARFL